MNLFGKVFLSAILLSLICASTLFSQPINHTGTLIFSKSTDVKEPDGVSLINLVVGGGRANFRYYVSYRISSLMGEPTVFCNAAVILEPRSTLGRNDYPILERIRVIDINFYGVFEGGKYIIPCDVGSPKRPFIGSVNEFENLSNERKSAHLSFNVAGSPNWDELVHVSPPGFTSTDGGVVMGWNSLNPGSNYLSATDSKKYLMNENFSFKKWSFYSSKGSFVEVAWDFSELERHLAELEKEEAEKILVETNERISNIKEEARKETEEKYEDNFWDQPDKAISKYDENEINGLEEQILSHKEQLEQEREKVVQADQKVTEIDRYLANKRNEIENRPSLENLRNLKRFEDRSSGNYGYKNSEDEIVIPPMYDYVNNFTEYGYAEVRLPGLWDSESWKSIEDKYSNMDDCLIDKANNRFLCFEDKDNVIILLRDRFSFGRDGEFYNRVVDKEKNQIFRTQCVFPGSEGLIPIAEKGTINIEYTSDLPCHYFKHTRIDVIGPYSKSGRYKPHRKSVILKLGYVDKNGETIISPQFHVVTKFRNGRARVGVVTNIKEDKFTNGIWGSTYEYTYTLSTWEIDREGKRVSDYKTIKGTSSNLRKSDWFSFEK